MNPVNKNHYTSADCREAFKQAGLAYADITLEDLCALQGYISIECARTSKLDPDFPLFIVPRRKDDSLVAKFDAAGWLIKAYLKVDRPGRWTGREAVSFNPDGFIGFCGELDEQNSQPIYRAFLEWLCDFAVPTGGGRRDG